MTVFKIHYTDANGNKLSTFASADTPEAASDGVKQNVPGAIVTKAKVDRSAKVSPRVGKRLINAAQETHKSFGQRVVDITDRMAEAIEEETPDYWDEWATEDLGNHH